MTKLKDPLVQLGEVVDWEAFRPLPVRVRVEHVFGAQCATRSKLIRCIGLKRSALAIGIRKELL